MFNIQEIKNRLQEFSDRIVLLKNLLSYNDKKNRLKEISFLLENSCNWKKYSFITFLKKEYFFLDKYLEKIDFLENKLINNINLFYLSTEEKDATLFLDIEKDLLVFEKNLCQLELTCMFSGKQDHLDCYMNIQSGSGGIEAQDWAKMLFKMYIKWCDLHELKYNVIDEVEGEIAGIKSVTIKISGNYAYGWLRTETGVHRLVRKSPFDSGKRRHTSFSSIFIYPALDNENINIVLNSSDLRIDVYRASGAGGQHINRTESAVRITHLPTNIVVQCQNDRSQHKNKNQAIKQLKSKLYDFECKKKIIKKKELEETKSNITWGSQIRSYVLDDSRIKDLRTGIEIRDIQSVLNGNLDKFIEASLKLGL